MDQSGEFLLLILSTESLPVSFLRGDGAPCGGAGGVGLADGAGGTGGISRWARFGDGAGGTGGVPPWVLARGAGGKGGAFLFLLPCEGGAGGLGPVDADGVGG